jgi:hypothetical protein
MAHRHFVAGQQVGRFWGKADIERQAQSARRFTVITRGLLRTALRILSLPTVLVQPPQNRRERRETKRSLTVAPHPSTGFFTLS